MTAFAWLLLLPLSTNAGHAARPTTQLERVIAEPTCAPRDRTAPSAAYRAAAARCAADVCGPITFAMPGVLRAERTLSERYRRLVRIYLSTVRDSAAEVERLRAARSPERIPVPMAFDTPTSWWTNFDASTAQLAALPASAKPVHAVTTRVREAAVGYAAVLGVRDRGLDRLLGTRLTIRAGPTAAAARAFAERGLKELEDRVRVDRSPDLARALVVFALEFSIESSPWGDHLADAHTIVLTPTTLDTPFAADVGVHEAAHAITHYAAGSRPVARAIDGIKAQLLAADPSHAPAHAEEDWADYFSARLSSGNLACAWAGSTLPREGFDYLEATPGDSHSPLFYRLIAIESAAGRPLPLSCRDALDARAAEVCDGRDSAPSAENRHRSPP